MATPKQAARVGVDTRPGPSTAKAARDLRTARRIVAAICLVLSPLGVGLVRGTIPGMGDIAGFAAYPGLAHVELTADTFVALPWPFAIVGIYRLLGRRTPILAAVGGAIAMVGWTMLPTLATLDALSSVLAQHGGASAQNVALFNAVNATGTVNGLFGLFLEGHEFGTLLLGLALARSRIVPVWAGIVVMVGIIVHPVSVVLSLRLLDIAAYTLITIGFAFAARAVLATPNDEWDLPPLPARAR